MADRTVIAHFMHEEEQGAAANLISNPQVTDSFVLGTIEESRIPELERRGLIVQVLSDQPLEETPGLGSPLVRSLRSVREGVDSIVAPEVPSLDPSTPAFYVISLAGPLLDDWKEEIETTGAQILDRIPQASLTIRCLPTSAPVIQSLPFVRSIRPYGRSDTGPVGTRPAFAEPPPGPVPGVPSRLRAMKLFDVRLHRPEDSGTVTQWLDGHGVAIAGAGGRKIRVYALDGSGLEDQIAALPEVANVEEYIPPKLHNDVARQLLGVDDPNSNPSLVIQQQGDGEIVGVADTGLDVGHQDFQGRIAGIVALGRANDPSDPHGHGTHVAGSVLGDGSASGGAIRGVAPKAQLFFQSLLDAQGGLGGLPVNLGDLFDEAYQQGVRIHNNSWGSAVRSMYTGDATDIDEFVASHRDMLVVFSAGNEGQAADRLNSKVGFVDWLSIGSPGSSKNALTVGASRSSRTAGGLSGLTWGQGWPQEFPDPPIASDKISGDPQGVAAFSSRGPCDDRRIKPDLVVPGTDILSTKSSRAPLRNYWSSFPGNGQYAFMGGTSMAAPLVSGAAALVREYYVKDKQAKPSGALLKATLINSTQWLTGADATADFALMPNFHQGFGRIHLPWAIPNASIPWFKLEFLDTWQDNALQFQRTGQRLRYQVDVAGGDWLRICLVWTDLPARALQNNLDLFLQEPGGAKRMGNADLPMSLHIPDPDNNAELIRLERPAPGTYLIQVSATNILRGPQDMALVVAGDLTSGLRPFL